MIPRLLKKPIRRLADFAASPYVAGTTIGEALKVVRLVNGKGFSTILCPWDRIEDSPKVVFAAYRQALESILNDELDSHLSIKAPSLNYDSCMIAELLEMAAPSKVRIHFDSMAPETADPTFTLVEELVKKYSNIGVTLPASWQRSQGDAAAIAKFGIPVRLVKGQWPDGSVAVVKYRDLFLQLVEVLAGKVSVLAVASHDPRLVWEALSTILFNKGAAELEQLFGLPFHSVQYSNRLGVNTRVYIPYGASYLPYALSQVSSNPRLGWLLAKDLVRGSLRSIRGCLSHP